MRRSVVALTAFLVLGVASFAVLSFAQDEQRDTTGGTMGNGGRTAPGMMGKGGMMQEMMGHGCCAGMMRGRGMMGGMGHAQRPNEQWRHRPEPSPRPDQG